MIYDTLNPSKVLFIVRLIVHLHTIPFIFNLPYIYIYIYILCLSEVDPFPYNVSMERTFLNHVQSNQIWIAINIFRLIWLVQNDGYILFY